MLPTLLLWLESLSASRAPQLAAGLALCGMALLIAGDHPLAVLAFLAQRVMVMGLLWSAIGLPLGSATAVASAAVALILALAELRLWSARRGVGRNAHWSAPSRSGLAVRVLAAALALLLTNGLVQTVALDLLSYAVTFPSVALLVSGFLLLLLSGGALQTALGVFAVSDALRVLYAAWQPDPLVWGIWAACDVLVALGASHLRDVELATSEGGAAGGSR